MNVCLQGSSYPINFMTDMPYMPDRFPSGLDKGLQTRAMRPEFLKCSSETVYRSTMKKLNSN
jgi:hypothetical protein